jgi:hypothetical protein
MSFGISGKQNVAILRESRNNTEQIKRSAPNDHCIEAKSPRFEIAIEQSDGVDRSMQSIRKNVPSAQFVRRTALPLNA